MLMPSAIPGGPRPRLQRMATFQPERQADPSQQSPPQTPITPQGVNGTCDALQSMLGTGPPPASRSGSRMQYESDSPLQSHPRRVLKKRPPPPLRPQDGSRKRRISEAMCGEMGEDEDGEGQRVVLHGYGVGLRAGAGRRWHHESAEQEDQEERRVGGAGGRSGGGGGGNGRWTDRGTSTIEEEREEAEDEEAEDGGHGLVSTPKRRRRFPPSMPLGITHDDFLHLDEGLDEDMAEDGRDSGSRDGLPPLFDEGYGSMEFQPSELKQALEQAERQRLQARRLQPFLHDTEANARIRSSAGDSFYPTAAAPVGGNGPFLRSPWPEQTDRDAMSVESPSSALSPQPQMGGGFDGGGRGGGNWQFAAPSLSPLECDNENPLSPLAIPDITLADPSSPPAAACTDRYPFGMEVVCSPGDGSEEPPLPTLPRPERRQQQQRPKYNRLPSLAHSDPMLPTPSPSTPRTTHQSPLHSAAPAFFPTPFNGGFAQQQQQQPQYQYHDQLPSQTRPSTSPAVPTTHTFTATSSNPTLTTNTHPHNTYPRTYPSHPGQRTHYAWTDADDRALVALVIDKLRLKKCDWDACARALGATGSGAGASLGRRWRELVGDGCVGLKFRYGGALLAPGSSRAAAAAAAEPSIGSGPGRGPAEGDAGTGFSDGAAFDKIGLEMGRRVAAGFAAAGPRGGRGGRPDVRALSWES